jgi:hypothetical protein
MSDRRQNQKVSLEDLLQLKRAERPTPEFWSNFERELRQKQLTALVEKRRWWHELPGLFNRRVYLPAGAAAAVAFTLVAVRYHSPMAVTQVAENSAPRIEAADPAVEMLPATVVPSLVQASRYEEPVADVQPATVASAAPAVAQAAARDEISPSARSIAANLARLEQSEPELLQAVMGSRLSSSARVQNAAVQVEPEAEEEAAPRYRLIARYADRALTPQPSAPAMVRERIARRLGDDLGDGMSRFGVGGDRVSLKF